MKINVRFWLVSLLAALALTVAACGGGGGEPAAEESEPAAEEGAAEGEGEEMAEGEGEEAAGGELTTSLEIAAAGEQLLFDKESLGPSPAGETVTLTFDNVSNINEHNWILLDTSDETAAADFNTAAADAGADADYIPEDTSLILSQTGLLAPGEVGEVEFAAPDAGEYIYVCTVPGHFEAGMWGVMTTE